MLLCVCGSEHEQQVWWQQPRSDVEADSALSPCAAVRRGEWPRALSRAGLAGLRPMRDHALAGSDQSRPARGGLGPPELQLAESQHRAACDLLTFEEDEVNIRAGGHLATTRIGGIPDQ